jgi:pantoate--beta-alanine ligase
MGALHAGHLALVERCLEACEVSVASIFVNPTQFNEASDLEKYPRTPAADPKQLSQLGCDILFQPTVDGIYPDGTQASAPIDLAGLDQVLEGAFRPGHFQGVVQVVSRLLDIVNPDLLFMGQKDYQQCAIIRHLIRQQQRPVELVVVPTVREADGLAMSSRNVRLTEKYRKIAPEIYKTLSWSQIEIGHRPIPEVETAATEHLQKIGLQPEYFAIVHAHTLQAIEDYTPDTPLVACTAAWAGDVRLIDNLILTPGTQESAT